MRPVPGGPQEMMVLEYIVDAGLDGLQALIFQVALLRPDDTDYLADLCRKHLDVRYPEGSEAVEAPGIFGTMEVVTANAPVSLPQAATLAEKYMSGVKSNENPEDAPVKEYKTLKGVAK